MQFFYFGELRYMDSRFFVTEIRQKEEEKEEEE